MSPREIAHRRLRSQQIVGAHCRTPGALVAALGAVQAQDYAGALWSLGLRLPGMRETDIEQAVADREIVRTWPMRGTLHFVAAADARWMLATLAPRSIAAAVGRRKQLELDDAVFAKCRKILSRALKDGQQKTRPDLYEILTKGGVSAEGSRGLHILCRLAQEGLICFGPRAGKQPTFVLLDEWLPATQPREREDALIELARRYFTGHGPATLADFTWWAGLKVTEARAAIAAVGDGLLAETIDGVAYWMAPESASAPAAKPTVHLLPGFDEYLLGYTDRRTVLDPQHAEVIVPGGNGMFMPTIVSDGKVIGTWKRTVSPKKVQMIGTPFRALKKTEVRALAAAAKGYGTFHARPVEWTMSEH